jgi:hypothetical protein
MDQGSIPNNHRDNLDITTAQLRTQFHYARFMIYRPFVYKALHFPELMTEEDQIYCALAIQSVCFWPLVLAPAKNKKRLVPYLFTWTQNFVGILLILRMTTESECLKKICNERLVQKDLEQTTISIDKTALEFTPQDLRKRDSIGFTHARASQRNYVSPSPSPLSGSPDIRLCCEAALHQTSIDSVHKALLHANESSTTSQLTARLFFLCLYAESACNASLLL